MGGAGNKPRPYYQGRGYVLTTPSLLEGVVILTTPFFFFFFFTPRPSLKKMDSRIKTPKVSPEEDLWKMVKLRDDFMSLKINLIIILSVLLF